MFRRLEAVLAGSQEAQGDHYRMVTVSLPSSGEPITDIQDEETMAAEVAAHSGTAAVFGIFDADRTVVVERCAVAMADISPPPPPLLSLSLSLSLSLWLGENKLEISRFAWHTANPA